jgi:hypothetical protein
MPLRPARIYIYLIFLVEILVLATSLTLHVCILIGTPNPFAEYNQFLWLGLAAQSPALFLAKDRNIWKYEFKTAPWWLQLLAGASFVYIFLVIRFSGVLSTHSQFYASELVVTAFAISFSLACLCIVHAILWSGSVSESDLLKRTRNSIIGLVLVATYFFIRQAGFLPAKLK